MAKMKSRKSARRRSSEERFDVYQAVTDKIVAALEDGVDVWRRPWASARRRQMTYFGEGLHRNLASKKAYRGINVILLDISAVVNHYESPYWLTFNQMKDRGGKLIKINAEDEPGTGQHPTMIVLWKPIVVTETDEETGQEKKRQIFLLRHFNVFNLDQIEGIEEPAAPQRPEPEQPEEPKEFSPLEAAESIYPSWENHPALRHLAQNRAFYSPMLDSVTMPERSQFGENDEAAEAYYSTLFHELTHATGHKKRLDRKFGDSFGDEPYAKEELVAEMGAAMLCGMVGIQCRDQSAAYVANWLSAIKNADKKFVVQAAAQAQKAIDMILGASPVEAEPVNGEMK